MLTLGFYYCCLLFNLIPEKVADGKLLEVTKLETGLYKIKK